MKHSSLAMAIAVGLLVIGCGGGGGGGSGGNTTPGTPSTETPVQAGVASFSGGRPDYSVARVGAGFSVTDRRTNGVTSVSGANAIRFSDLTINLGIGDKAVALGATRLKSLIELYMACLGRVPEADSLVTGIGQLMAGQTMTQVADRLYAEAILLPAVSGFSASMIHTEFVEAVYKNVFGRFGDTAPASADVATWSNRIDKGGISRGALVLEMLEAARAGSPGLASATTIQLLDNKAEVGDYVAVRQGITYNSAADSVARTQAIAAAVTSTDMSAAQILLGFSDASFNLKVSGN